MFLSNFVWLWNYLFINADDFKGSTRYYVIVYKFAPNRARIKLKTTCHENLFQLPFISEDMQSVHWKKIIFPPLGRVRSKRLTISFLRIPCSMYLELYV